MSDAVATNGKVVEIHYTLSNDAGEVLDRSNPEHPLTYLHGARNIVPGLEKQIEGHKSGDTLNAVVPPEEAYGERGGIEPQTISRAGFPPDAELHVGLPLLIENDKGQSMPVWIAGFTDDDVTIDFNHPLAGETLHFEVEVIGVRDATSEEVEHGHPHQAGCQHCD